MEHQHSITSGSAVPRYLRVRQVADLTTLSTATLNKFRVTGGGPPFKKLGKAVIYRQDEVLAWLEERPSVASTSAIP